MSFGDLVEVHFGFGEVGEDEGGHPAAELGLADYFAGKGEHLERVVGEGGHVYVDHGGNVGGGAGREDEVFWCHFEGGGGVKCEM